MAESIENAFSCPRPPSAAKADAARTVSSIVRFLSSSSSRSSQRTAKRERRTGARADPRARMNWPYPLIVLASLVGLLFLLLALFDPGVVREWFGGHGR
jgi:hypothetical protein